LFLLFLGKRKKEREKKDEPQSAPAHPLTPSFLFPLSSFLFPLSCFLSTLP